MCILSTSSDELICCDSAVKDCVQLCSMRLLACSIYTPLGKEDENLDECEAWKCQGYLPFLHAGTPAISGDVLVCGCHWRRARAGGLDQRDVIDCGSARLPGEQRSSPEILMWEQQSCP